MKNEYKLEETLKFRSILLHESITSEFQRVAITSFSAGGPQGYKNSDPAF